LLNPNQQESLIMSDPFETKTPSKRGFASMDPQRQREIASLGGKAAHASGRAHEFNSAEAREAGRKGGRAGRRKSAEGSAPA
jgi:hypothetical protein